MLTLLLALACRSDKEPIDTSPVADTGPFDLDGDGSFASEDCDDTDPRVHPGAVEVCNGLDDDCTGVADDAVGGIWYADEDGDGFGDPELSSQACEPGDGQVADDRDCDDTDAAIHIAADEICDGSDNDCDGEVDADAVDAPDWYADADGDGWGDPDTVTRSCDAPSSTVSNSEDCDDTNAQVHPELWWYGDGDGDGYGNEALAVQACEAPDGFVADSTDCDDGDSSAWPDNPELCDEVDNDCNGVVDEDVLETFYRDADGDGYGDATTQAQACTAPSGFSSDATDCDDLDSDNWPGNTEVCDGADNDCDSDVDEGVTSSWYLDVDGDGYGTTSSEVEDCSAPSSAYSSVGGDCDDGDSAYNPGATPGCDGEDYDCDGSVDNDGDGDGYADLACGGDDCDDADANVATCASCLDILAGNSSATDGSYDIDPDGDGTYDTVECDMTTDGGGWTQVTDLDFSVDSCPGAWVQTGSLCYRDEVSSGSRSATFDTLGVSYDEVLGTLEAYQYYSMDAFGQSRNSSNSLDQTYVDGFSLTVDDGNGNRVHVFSWAIGLTPGYNTSYDCPGDGGEAPPSFVGSDYLCETGNTSSSWTNVWYSPALFVNTPVQVTLSGTTTEDLEGRLMSNQDSSNEDIGVAAIELWVR